VEAILIAELADHACWEALMALAQQAGEEALVEPFERALTAEQEHLQKVQAWRAAGQERPELGRCEQARSRQLMTLLVYEDFRSS
jgi:hypothetical protein